MRHPHHDYTKAGAYFVTFCTHQGWSIFGRVTDHKMILNPLGQIAANAWHKLANRHPNVAIDIFVIMPNHVHVLLWLVHDPNLDNRSAAPKERAFGDAVAGSLSTFIGAYKSSVTQRARRAGLASDQPIWQRNFYDSIVRNEASLQRIRDYIRANPERWQGDKLHPAATSNRFNAKWRSGHEVWRAFLAVTTNRPSPYLVPRLSITTNRRPFQHDHKQHPIHHV